jgi:hypothetical protein
MNQDTIHRANPQTRRQSVFSRIWRGEGQKAWGLRLLVVEGLIFLITGFVYDIALSMLRWPAPFTILGYALLIIVLLGWFLFTWVALRYVRDLGLRRVLPRLILIYVAYVAIRVVLDLPSFPGTDGVWVSVTSTNQDIKAYFSDFIHTIYQTPDKVSFAISGRRNPIQVNGTTLAATPIEFDLSAQSAVTSDSNDSTENGNDYPTQTAPSQINSGNSFSIGQRVWVSNTGGKGLRLRENPSLSATITVRLRDNDVVVITHGPQYADGYIWWHVENASGEGWCVVDYLKHMDE